VVLVAAPRACGSAFEHALALEVGEALGEQGAGDAGQTALDVVEARASEDQLAQDQGRPPIGEHLAGERHGAVLAVLAGHRLIVARVQNQD
jgi:hypothetical protein